jgi:hypothetical protein
VGILVVVWLIFAPAEFSYAEDEVTLQVSSSNTTTEQILPGSTVVIQTPEDIIEAAQTAISQAETATAVTKIDAISITSPTWTITDTITQAETSTALAQTVVDSAIVALAHKVQAEETAEVAISEKNIALSNLQTATTTLQSKTTALNVAQSAVNSQVIVVNTEQSELTALQNTPSNSMTYTTDGYVAPQNIDTNVISTVVLPPMGDASTKIETPFDIKLGETLYEGQGNNSQLYVTSKSAITFGQGDHTYFDWPSIAGIYVFQSDYMSNGPGASITVTTTSNTLQISWDLHRFGDNNGPITNTDLYMIVNPESGEWTATATLGGNTTGLYGGPRTGVREVTGEPVQSMTSVGNTQLQSQIADQQIVVQQETTKLNNLITAKDIALSEKTVATQNVATTTTVYNAKNISATNAISFLTYTTNAVNQAVALIAPAISNMNYAVSEAQEIVSDTLEQEEAARQAAEAAAQAAYQAQMQAQAAAQAAAQAEAEAAAEAAAQAEAEAAAEAAAQAEAEAAAEAAAQAEAAAEAAAQAEADRLEAEQAAAEQAEQDRLEEEAAQEEAEQQAIDDAIEQAIEDALDGKELTEEQKELVLEALLEDSNGKALSSEDIKKAGLDYEDLPPSTPVDVRTDENGNAVVITAAVAAQIELLQNPGELLSTVFSDPGAALAALGSIGADMSDAEREEATDMVIATVVAAGAAINAAAVAAAGGSTGGSSSGGGSSGGGSGANSPGSRGGRRW